MNTRISTIYRWGILCLIFGILGFLPKIVGPGIDAPTPISAYLNGAFPDQAPSSMTSVSYTIENAFPNLTFIDPLDLAEMPNNKLMMIGKPGYVWVFDNDPTASNKTLVLDISAHTILGGDSGLLGVVLHPSFATNGYFYLWYRYTPTANSENSTGYMRLERFRLQFDGSGVPFIDSNDAEHVLIQQFDTHNWHNGGDMFFGPDGFLYLSIGDEGGANDQFNTTQRLDQWLFGGVLRIDVDQQGGSISHAIGRQPINPSNPPSGWPNSYSQNYYIPNDNPWTGSNGALLEEFFSIGTRSPHRMTYDPVDDEIWIGDIGQGSREEISVIDRGLVLSGSNGANMQWPYREGDINGPKAKPSPLIGYDNPPIFAYPRSFGTCVIGGYVVRGNVYPELDGKYLLADHTVQNIWTLTKDAGGGTPTVEFLLNVPFEGQGSKDGISSFGMTSDGTIYILDLFGTGLDGGKIHKLVRNTSSGTTEPPEKLSDVNVFQDFTTLSPVDGLVPYDIAAPFWSDRALKSRWIALPNDGSHNTPAEQIIFDKEENWQFPPGTVAVKHFELPIDEQNPGVTTRLETRFLIFDKDGGAYGITYRWNDEGTEAFLLRNGETRDIVVTRLDGSQFTQTWQFPDRQQCMSCHNNIAGFGLGLKTRQINKDFTYPSGIASNQLETWNHLGMFDREIGDPKTYPQNTDLANTESTEEFRISSYLDGNCSYCHRPNGAQAVFDARSLTALHDQKLINTEVSSSASPAGGIVVKPGLSAESVLWSRDNSTGSDAMPPIAKSIVDEDYIQVLTSWIDGLSSNAPESINEGWYFIEARHSDQVLAAKNGFTYHNADIVQQQETNEDYQKWYAQNIGGNKFVFINQASSHFLAIENMLAGQGVQIVQQEWTGMQNQLWYIEAVGDFYQIKSAYNGMNLFIDGASSSAGTPLVTALPDGAETAQQFSLVPLSGSPIVFDPVDCQVANYVSEVLPQCRYTLKFVDSEEPTDGTGDRAFDGNVNTIWHTEWRASDPTYPHEIQFALESSFMVSGLRYLPRQSGVNGTIANYEVYVSQDGANWGSPVATGTWLNNINWKTASFTPQKARYVRLRGLSEVNGNPWASAAEIEIVASACMDQREIIGENGLASVNHNWTTVTLSNSYNNPVVIAGAVALGDPEATSVRVRNVTSTTFEVRLEEWSCSDQVHPLEDLPYLVVETGIHKLLDGTTIMAGNSPAVTNSWQTISYQKPFITSPIIFSQCTSTNEASPVVTRINHANTNQQQFEVKLQEDDANPNAAHAAESLAWIALEPSTHSGNFSFESGRTDLVVDETLTSIDFDQCYTDPIFISRLASYYGADPSGSRYTNLTATGVDVFVEEEVCSDAEIGHANEIINYWVFNEVGDIYGNTMSLIHAKIYLQGAWNGTEMATTLYDAGLLPLVHPYSEAPWVYHGNECVSVVPPDAVDWVLVQIRHAEDAAKVIAQRACFVRKDGVIMDLDGTEGVYFNEIDLTTGYVSVLHRNHLGVATSSPVNLR